LHMGNHYAGEVSATALAILSVPPLITGDALSRCSPSDGSLAPHIIVSASGDAVLAGIPPVHDYSNPITTPVTPRGKRPRQPETQSPGCLRRRHSTGHRGASRSHSGRLVHTRHRERSRCLPTPHLPVPEQQ
jgi:hypothetical protein